MATTSSASPRHPTASPPGFTSPEVVQHTEGSPGAWGSSSVRSSAAPFTDVRGAWAIEVDMRHAIQRTSEGMHLAEAAESGTPQRAGIRRQIEAASGSCRLERVSVCHQSSWRDVLWTHRRRLEFP